MGTELFSIFKKYPLRHVNKLATSCLEVKGGIVVIERRVRRSYLRGSYSDLAVGGYRS